MSLHQTSQGKFTVQISKADPLKQQNLRLCMRVEGRVAAERQEASFKSEAAQWHRERLLIKEAGQLGLTLLDQKESIPTSSVGFLTYLEGVYLPWANLNLEHSTLASRASAIAVLAEDLLGTPLDQIENVIDPIIARWRQEGCRFRAIKDAKGRVLARKPKPISDAGINERIKVLRAILGHAHKVSRILQFLPRISMLKKKRAMPGESSPVRYFLPEERARFLRYSKKGADDVFQIGVLTGMRPGELFHMLVSWIDFRQNKILIQACECPLCPNKKWIPKTGSYRAIEIAPDLLPILRRLAKGKPDNTLVLDNQHGRPYIALPGSNGRFARTLKLAGLDRKGLSGYSMRHTAAADLITAGHSIQEVAAFLGNSPRTCEMHYAHLIPNQGSGVAKSLKAVNPWPGSTPVVGIAKPVRPATISNIADESAA